LVSPPYRTSCYDVEEERTVSSFRAKNPAHINAEVAAKKRMCLLYGDVKGKCAQSKQLKDTSVGLLKILILLLNMTLELGFEWWSAVNKDEVIFA